jgi:hypothetical protein
MSKTSEDIPEIPDALFDTEVSEEETDLTNDKGKIHKVMVPKINVCPYACVGCDQYIDHIDEN